MVTDVLYVTWNRLEFTKFSFQKLLEGTNWELVNRFVVYDDNSTDGTLEFMKDAIQSVPADTYLVESDLKSPPGIMNSYMETFSGQDAFAKIDNDIVVPPNWLQKLTTVMNESPTLEILGMEAGRGGFYRGEGEPTYTWEPCSHIGGVGLIKTSVFEGKSKISENGRFGWTEWQHDNEPVRGWITPSLLVCCLDQIPEEPWCSLSDEYIKLDWQRNWTKYDGRWRYYWEWWNSD